MLQQLLHIIYQQEQSSEELSRQIKTQETLWLWVMDEFMMIDQILENELVKNQGEPTKDSKTKNQ